MVNSAASAQTDPPVQTDPQAPVKKIKWSYGVRVIIGDVKNAGDTTRFRPSLGLEWGRWRFGSVDSEQFVGADTLQRSASLSYGVVDEKDFQLRASMRLHNLRTGGDIDALASGPRTLRGRLSGSRALNTDWTAFGETTIDLLGKGDGFTANLGLGRTLRRTAEHTLGASLSMKYATASHWQYAYLEQLQGKRIGAGLGDVTAGLGLRGRLGKEWGYESNLSTSWPVGVVRSTVGGKPVTGLQFGVRRFVN